MDDTTQFFRAIDAGDVEQVQRLLDEHPTLARARDEDGATALHHAAFNGHRALVALLCDRGADINARDGAHGATPSGWAMHSLRERGGLLAVEIDDALYAIQTRDATWARRLITRHPALVTATDTHGKSLAEHARDSGDAVIAGLFALA